ncbi:uncharacterized protein LOC125315239 [Rhodamnia argentea]|uniref:Uncharacterized protein LOC125315239 n=1 Tax=Rhodamnia argentea TaxID=178133 RepID=A0ABM3HGC3_9MYRT|nr:uncharacterized protein LOC125315239 [Rhodamnia argentea]
MWDYLKDEYEGDEKIRSMKVLNLLREFERQRMKDSESVKEYSDRLIEIAEKIEDLADIKLAELLSAPQAQEQRRLMRRVRREEPVEGTPQAKVKFNDGGKGKKWNQSKGNAGDSKFAAKEGSSSGSGKWKKNKKPCQHRGGTTHRSFRCWRRPDAKCRRCHKMGHMEAIRKENNHQQAGEAQIAMNETEEERLFVASYSGSPVENDAWLVDSGCTNHMTSNLKSFRSLDKSVGSKVRIGNGQDIEVQGKGTVAIEGNQEVKPISDVLFVPKIDQNLLSVGQLVERGYKVKFEGKECLIDNADSKEVLRMPMKDKCFLFKPQEMQQMALKCKEENASYGIKARTCSPGRTCCLCGEE